MKKIHFTESWKFFMRGASKYCTWYEVSFNANKVLVKLNLVPWSPLSLGLFQRNAKIKVVFQFMWYISKFFTSRAPHLQLEQSLADYKLKKKIWYFNGTSQHPLFGTIFRSLLVGLASLNRDSLFWGDLNRLVRGDSERTCQFEWLFSRPKETSFEE